MRAMHSGNIPRSVGYRRAPKNWRFERRSRAADDRRNDEQSAMLSAEARQTTSALWKSAGDVSFQRDVREKRPINGGC
jgi:hypothetical protein